MAFPLLAALPGILQGALAATQLIGALRDLFSPQPKPEDFTAQARQINEAEFARARENLIREMQQSALSRGLFGSGPMAEALSRALADLNAQQASATAQTATQLWQQAQGQRTARQGQAANTLFGLLQWPLQYAQATGFMPTGEVLPRWLFQSWSDVFRGGGVPASGINTNPYGGLTINPSSARLGFGGGW